MAIDNFVPVTKFKQLPYDYYCQNVKNLDGCVCSICGVYFPSKATVDRHKLGFGCVTKQKLPSQLIPVARPTFNEEIEDMVCEGGGRISEVDRQGEGYLEKWKIFMNVIYVSSLRCSTGF